MYIFIISLLVIILLVALSSFLTENQGLKDQLNKTYNQLEKIRNEKIQQAADVEAAQQTYDKITHNIQALNSQVNDLNDLIAKKREEANQEYLKQTKINDELLEKYKANSEAAAQAYKESLDKKYEEAKTNHDIRIVQLEREEIQARRELEKIKSSLAAGVKAQLREQEKKDKQDFYKIVLSENELSDIVMLESIKNKLHDPVILNKLIWSTYFQKKTTDLCNRILGTDKICGIYKITNVLTEQVYIGQSVDISTRWKSHIKCGLGIDASTTNKLYNNMQKDGVWNFTFELMEKCSKELLNEKEAQWIKMYQSDKFGFNITKGNKTI